MLLDSLLLALTTKICMHVHLLKKIVYELSHLPTLDRFFAFRMTF